MSAVPARSSCAISRRSSTNTNRVILAKLEPGGLNGRAKLFDPGRTNYQVRGVYPSMGKKWSLSDGKKSSFVSYGVLPRRPGWQHAAATADLHRYPRCHSRGFAEPR